MNEEQQCVQWAPGGQTTLERREAIEAYARRSRETIRTIEGTRLLDQDAIGIEETDGAGLRYAVYADGERWHMTQRAGHDLCRRLGVQAAHLTTARSREACEEAIDAIMRIARTDYGRSQSAATRLVVDDEQGVVQGMVGRNYARFEHDELLRCLDPESEAFGWVDGTMLRIEERPGGSFEIQTPDGPDHTRLRRRLRNSLAGESAIEATAMVFRTVCHNGLMGLAAMHGFRLEHRAKKENDTLEPAIRKIVDEAVACMRETERMLERLGTTRTSLDAIAASTTATEAWTQCMDALAMPTQAQRLRSAAHEGSSAIRKEIERCFNGIGPASSRHVVRSPFRTDCTAWDVVNIVTEGAREGWPPGSLRREAAETAAGALGRAIVQSAAIA